MVRAKFICESVLNTRDGATVCLRPVYGNGNPDHENSKFFRFTPSGKIEMGTINREAAAQFAPGAEYYVDFMPAE